MSRMNRHRASSHVVFGDVEYPPDGAFGPRMQQHYQLVLIYEGEARIQIEDTVVWVPEQHAVLLLPHRREQFQFARTRSTHHTWCAIAPQLVPPELQIKLAEGPTAVPGRPGLSPCLPLTTRIYALVEYGLALPQGAPGAAEALLDAVGVALLHAFVLERELAHGADDVPAAVRRAQQFVELHLDEQLTLARIAGAASVTPQHLTRLFRRHLQTTPARYLWKLRTLRGFELLGQTGLSIGEIAERVGFQTPFHFSRMIRQHYRYSPRQLRERLWRGEPSLSL